FVPTTLLPAPAQRHRAGNGEIIGGVVWIWSERRDYGGRREDAAPHLLAPSPCFSMERGPGGEAPRASRQSACVAVDALPLRACPFSERDCLALGCRAATESETGAGTEPFRETPAWVGSTIRSARAPMTLSNGVSACAT